MDAQDGGQPLTGGCVRRQRQEGVDLRAVGARGLDALHLPQANSRQEIVVDVGEGT